MKRLFPRLILCSAIGAALFSEPTLAAKKDAAITVNGQVITRAQLEAVIQSRIGRGINDSPELRAAIQNQLVHVELLSQEAKKRKLDKKPEVQTQISILNKEALQQAAIEDFLRSHPVSETEARSEYDRVASQAGDRREYAVRHILVGSEEEAKEILDQLGKGGKFADLAKRSKDTVNSDNGGDLGWQTPQNFAPPFAQAMTKLSKGEHTLEPVKTDFGFHVIQVDDTRPLPLPNFEKVKPEIESLLIRNKVGQYVRDLREKAKIVVAPLSGSPVKETPHK